jgi:hypothetical protein
MNAVTRNETRTQQNMKRNSKGKRNTFYIVKHGDYDSSNSIARLATAAQYSHFSLLHSLQFIHRPEIANLGYAERELNVYTCLSRNISGPENTEIKQVRNIL